MDVSGWTLAGDTTATLAAGTVIPAGEALYLTDNVAAFRARTSGPSGGQALFVQGYDGELADDAGILELRSADGALVATTTYGGTAIPRANATNVRITEVNYHPLDAMPQFGELEGGASQFEFIEIMNISSDTIELDQAKFGDGIEFTFAAQQLGPGERLAVVANPVAFASRYGADVAIAKGYRQFADGFESRLANDGETISLVSTNGEVIESFAYGDQRGWAERADGRGSTLVRTNVDSDPNRPGSWQASTSVHGSPGEAINSVNPTVVINEIAPRNATNEVSQIELLNVSDAPVTLNAYLSDSGTDPLKFRITDRTIAPNSFVVFGSNDLNFEFKSDSADDAWLIASDATGRPTHFLDVVEFPETPQGSRGRVPNGTGEFVLLGEPTFGTANSSAAVDLNNDQVSDLADVDLLCTGISSQSADLVFDLTKDGKIDLADMRYLIEMVLQTNFGDANLDGHFDTRDLVDVFSAAEFEDSIDGNSTWSEGDWNCDGDATTRDLVLAFQSGSYGQFAKGRDGVSRSSIAAWQDADSRRDSRDDESKLRR